MGVQLSQNEIGSEKLDFDVMEVGNASWKQAMLHGGDLGAFFLTK